jgi:hypothetical protein
MDLTKVRQGEKIAGIAGALFIIVMFLSWWNFSGGGFSVNGQSINVSGVSVDYNAWELSSFMDIIWFVTALSGVALFLMAANNVALNLPIAMSAIATGLGAFSTLLIIYRLIDPPYSAGRAWGAFVGLILMAVMTYGAWTAMQEEGATFTPSGGTGGTGGSPPPPPPPPSAPPPPRA